MPIPYEMPKRTNEELAAVPRNRRDPNYGAGFMNNNLRDHGRALLAFGEVVWSLFRPASVVEFGCGTGYTLHALAEHGTRCTGLDFSAVSRAFVEEINPDLAPHIHRRNFDEERFAGPEHELAISIEVLEHLKPETAPLIVGDICRAAPLALVTACPPVGRNALHLNEQPFPFWVNLFEQEGHELDRQTTEAVKAAMRVVRLQSGIVVPTWHTSSYFGVFRRGGVLD